MMLAKSVLIVYTLSISKNLGAERAKDILTLCGGNKPIIFYGLN